MKSTKAIFYAFILTFLTSGGAWGQMTTQTSKIDPSKPDQIKPIEKTGYEQSESTPEIPLGKGRIEFEETTFDFGSIAKGSRVTHNFWFENTGTDTLIVTKVTPTCGCTSTRKGMIVVPPQGHSSIDVIFDSGKFNGKVTKSIKIECNDALSPYLDLRFKATINNPLQTLEYSPLMADFQTVPTGKKSTIRINLTNIDSTQTRINIIEKPASEFIKTTLKNDNLAPGATTQIELTLISDVEPGTFLSSITLEAEGKSNSRITIPISGTIGTGSTEIGDQSGK
jgi:hypothetical protein